MASDQVSFKQDTAKLSLVRAFVSKKHSFQGHFRLRALVPVMVKNRRMTTMNPNV